ncbi:MAG: PEP-CTERM sorting domain-containing protein [Rhizobacter sp.]
MQLNQVSKVAAACVLLWGTAFQAHAATYNLGTVSSGAPLSFNAAVTSAGAFSDIFTFTLPAAFGTGFSLLNFPVGGLFNTVLTSATLFSNADGALFSSDDTIARSGTITSTGISFTGGASAAGSYYLNVTGIATGPQGGLYNGAISVAAVPEPETYAMLLAGLGVMGFIARRRNNAQQ